MLLIFASLQDPNQDETFWNKFGTLGKSKKRAQEVKVVETEGKYAIDSPGMPKSAEMPPEVNKSILRNVHGFCTN